MSTFSRIALTATLASGVWLLSAKFAQAEVATIAKSLNALSVGKALSSALDSGSHPFTQFLDSTFDPEPNDPPDRTGGSGTR